MSIEPKPLPPEFRRDVIAVARKDEASMSRVARQGSCKVSVTRPDLRLWRPAAEVERPEALLRLHLQGEHLTRAQVRATCGRSLDATAPCRHRIAASLRRHPSRSTACLTTLHEPWGNERASAAVLATFWSTATTCSTCGRLLSTRMCFAPQ